eukprot:jgi/Ulvmu1/8276/UM041_0087.1
MEETTRSISDQEWEQKCEKFLLPTQDLNSLVMNFLTTEGYLDAARTFEKESGTPMDRNMDRSQERMHIRNAIEHGELEQAISQVNDLNPEILESNAKLCFHIQQQQVIELIRSGKVNEALLFAQEYLAYKGEDNPDALDDLENTIALIAFEDPSSCPCKHLMELQQRQMIASELNKAILARLNHSTESKLASLVKMLAWCQDRLESRAKFPRLTDLKIVEGSSIGRRMRV